MTQSNHASLLVELLTEELPPKALARLGTAFAEGIVERLAARDLIEGAVSFEQYATPRRLAVLIRNVRDVAPEKQVREKCCRSRSRSTRKAIPRRRSRRNSPRSASRLPARGARTRAGRQGRGVLPALCGARRDARRRPASRARRNADQAADPEGHDVSASGRHQRAVRASGAAPCRHARPQCRAGERARRRCGRYDHRPSLSVARLYRDSERRRLLGNAAHEGACRRKFR